MTQDSTYIEHAPDISKRIWDRAIADYGDEKTNADDGKGRGGLNEHRDGIGVYPGHLWAEHLPQECSHS